jgi:hypothetical protein
MKDYFTVLLVCTCTGTFLDEPAISGTNPLAILTRICPTEQQLLPDYRAVIVQERVTPGFGNQHQPNRGYGICMF